jgi:hypothetical protein
MTMSGGMTRPTGSDIAERARRHRRRVMALTVPAVAVLVLAVAAGLSPYGRAVLKSRRHFVRHPEDRRVFFEPGADSFAAHIAAVLPQAVSLVEQRLSGPFPRPFRVYVTSSQRSHNEFIAAPGDAPIRGCALLGNVYIAPSAFSFYGFDTHRQSLAHELVHLYIFQRLGFLRTRRIPVWFVEGLAHCIAGTGGEGVDEATVVGAIRDGRGVAPSEQGRLFQSVEGEARGLPVRVYQLQNRMFVQFLMDRYPACLELLVRDVLQGRPFARSFAGRFGRSVSEAWEEFRSSLSTRGLTGR